MGKCCQQLVCQAFSTNGFLKWGLQPDGKLMSTMHTMSGSFGQFDATGIFTYAKRSHHRPRIDAVIT
eukprot:11656743-Heterocapsa_arctica.AAC.1